MYRLYISVEDAQSHFKWADAYLCERFSVLDVFWRFLKAFPHATERGVLVNE